MKLVQTDSNLMVVDVTSMAASATSMIMTLSGANPDYLFVGNGYIIKGGKYIVRQKQIIGNLTSDEGTEYYIGAYLEYVDGKLRLMNYATDQLVSEVDIPDPSKRMPMNICPSETYDGDGFLIPQKVIITNPDNGFYAGDIVLRGIDTNLEQIDIALGRGVLYIMDSQVTDNTAQYKTGLFVSGSSVKVVQVETGMEMWSVKDMTEMSQSSVMPYDLDFVKTSPDQHKTLTVEIKGLREDEDLSKLKVFLMRNLPIHYRGSSRPATSGWRHPMHLQIRNVGCSVDQNAVQTTEFDVTGSTVEIGSVQDIFIRPYLTYGSVQTFSEVKLHLRFGSIQVHKITVPGGEDQKLRMSGLNHDFGVAVFKKDDDGNYQRVSRIMPIIVTYRIAVDFTVSPVTTSIYEIFGNIYP